MDKRGSATAATGQSQERRVILEEYERLRRHLSLVSSVYWIAFFLGPLAGGASLLLVLIPTILGQKFDVTLHPGVALSVLSLAVIVPLHRLQLRLRSRIIDARGRLMDNSE